MYQLDNTLTDTVHTVCMGILTQSKPANIDQQKGSIGQPYWALDSEVAGAALEEAGPVLRAVGKSRAAWGSLTCQHAALGAIHWRHIPHPLLHMRHISMPSQITSSSLQFTTHHSNP